MNGGTLRPAAWPERGLRGPSWVPCRATIQNGLCKDADPCLLPIEEEIVMGTIVLTRSARCFNCLSDHVADIANAWKQRWGMEMPGYCFRGADNSRYDLNPGLLREPYPSGSEELAKLENGLWVEFRLRSMSLLGRRVSTAWEAMLIQRVLSASVHEPS